MTLPLEPDLAPMLAKLGNELPEGDEWSYEPKWDGFRALVFRDDDEISIQSRDQRTLERYFPELPRLLTGNLPERCVVDGEIIIPGTEGLDFGALLQRIHPADSRVRMLAEATPASFVAFDLLALNDDAFLEEPLSERRARLGEELGTIDGDVTAAIRNVATSGRAHKRFMTGTWTSDAKVAQNWMDEFERVGLDGIVAKQLDSTYLPNKRGWVKVKQHRTVDCVVGGYRLSKAGDGIGSLLLGLYNDAGQLHYIGHTSSFKAAERREILQKVKPLEGGESFGGARAPGGPSRWTGGRDTSWVPLTPTLVCEVGYDRMLGERFRHAVTFLRWRSERAPKSCTFDQLPGFLRP
ncbi:MAG TPA: ATP-dependent DNA ligase [Actinomycetota bacterium]|nr:ATP-dependent DNA ligase [Actinomycetota bacterium]